MKQFLRGMGLSVGLAGVIAAALAVLGLVANGRLLLAQNGSHITVLRELEHDTSPPLDKIPPLPPEAGPKREVPFRPTHGPFAPRPQVQADAVLQTSPSGTSAPSSEHNYLGLGTGFTGPNGSFTVQYIPPDTNGAVGDTQFVQWVNASFAVLDKSDGHPVYGPAAGNTLWSGFGGACQRTNSGDPIAQYDELDNRWVMMQPVFKSPYYICVAVSTTSDATGSYNRYAFQVPNRLFPDYPKLGIWSDGYYLTYNQFQGNFFQGAAACALDRGNMLLGNAATMQCFTVNPAYGSLLPADFDGTQASSPPGGSPAYFLNFNGNNASLDLWQFYVDWNNPNNSTLGEPTNIPVASFSEACGGGACVPQAGTSQKLDSLGDRLMYRLAYRSFTNHESLVVSHSVDAGSGRTGVRWYELQKSGVGSFALHQQGTYSPDTDKYRWMSSIAMDKNGNIAMGYSASSGSMSPTIRYTGRTPADPSGQMGSETDLLASITHGSQTGYARWGDYASMAIDPVDDCTFWFTTEYQRTNGNAWSTRIASFSFPDCSGSSTLALSSVSLSPTSVVGPDPSTGTVTLTAAAPSGGTVASLISSNSVATVPPSITVPEGATSATFAVTTYLVAATTSATITASYSGVDKTATLTVDPPAASDFSLSASPSSLTLTQGQSSTSTVTVSALSGFTGTVDFAVTGCPTSPSNACTISQGSVTGSGTATLTVNTSSSTTPGSYNIMVTGTSGGSLTHSATVALTVNAPAAGDFSLSASPGNVTLKGAGTASYNVTVTSSGGYSGTVNLAVSGVPSGASATTASITGGSATLTVTTSGSTPRGNYTLTIMGTDGALNHSVTVGLKVR